MTIQPHDFTKPPSLHPETRSKLTQWVSRANGQLAEVISGFGLKVEVQLTECATAWPFNTCQQWSEKALVYRGLLGNVSATSLFCIPNPLAQVLIGSMLGEQPADWPLERDLTPGEESVGEFILGKILGNLIDTWTEDDALPLKLTEREPNIRRTKIFKFREPFIVCRSTITTPLGSGEWCWMLPHEFLVELFGSVQSPVAQTAASSREQLELLARDMSTALIVQLGSVQLSPPQLANLRVGDLVVLNQRTTEPLKAMVTGKPKFLGWPGRVGNRQAFEIMTDGGRRERPAETASNAASVQSH